MPLIIPFDSTPPLIVIANDNEISADGGVAGGLSIRIVNANAIVADLSAVLQGEILIDNQNELFLTGRLNGEANVFGEIEIDNVNSIAPAPRLRARAKIVITHVNTLTLGPRVAVAETGILNVTLNVGPAPAAGFGMQLSARLTVDGTAFPIRSFSYDEPRNAAGQTLQLQLQKPGDRAAILAGTSFKFEIYKNGTWIEMFDDGLRSSAGYSFAFVDARPNDALSISTIGPIAATLEKSPVEDLIVYDPLRETLNAADFRVIYDTDGFAHVQQLYSIAGMRLKDLLHYVLVTKLGFAGYQTDLQNSEIRRADFQRTGTWLSGIAPHIGYCKPLIFVRSGIVWILDSTQRIPAGFAAPIALTAPNYKSANLTANELNADGFELSFSDTETDYDYTTDEEIADDPDIIGTYGNPNYQQINRSRTYRHYFKTSNPLVPVRTDKISEIETTQAVVGGSLLTVHTTNETIERDGFGRLSQIRKDTNGLIQDAGTPGYPIINVTLREERTEFLYVPDQFRPRRQILGKTTKTISGVVVLDTVNLHLGKPFRQTYEDAARAGNLNSDQTRGFDAIQTVIETNEQTAKGQTECRTKTIDFLTDPPTVLNQTTDARAGDNSINGSSSAQNKVIVFRAGAVRTDARILPLDVGELPLKYAKPLARRMLANTRQATGSVILTGLDLSFRRGTVFELFDRDGFSIGSFIVEGLSIAGSDLGTGKQATSQTLQVTEI